MGVGVEVLFSVPVCILFSVPVCIRGSTLLGSSRRLIYLGLLDTLPAPPVEPSRLVVVALVQLSLLDVCWRLTSEPPYV